jgi:hypothetical protein
VLVEPVLDHLSDTQALTYMPLTSEYYLGPTHSRRDYMQANSPVEAINAASGLREHPKAELRGLEPLASCMPWRMLTFTATHCQERASCVLDEPSTYARNNGQTTVKIPPLSH